ncbi:hypothetical protein BGW36DRAFT_440155 [Talaromyces proteolyticus]|uniref:Zn(2)-C6 fungal-type domain-containing protein n=1 Tax=Talaromyces proteolyticus TaxID=1131652 RepID=A0AAD4PV38_9EURO|nr:uncharacterized protein BGW36DRAFT_440155 [Talaromyces proteolyticus]KAH8690834.1 hypothetical protein BGW36DRAFT_440155 [Talaromyces proteolyticus]
MPPHFSKGCSPCRARKVKCDEHRPSCRRCIRRGDLCSGYRDPVSLLFRDETEKAQKLSMRRRASMQNFSSSSSSSQDSPVTVTSQTTQSSAHDHTSLSSVEVSDFNLDKLYPWVKATPTALESSIEEQAVSQFLRTSLPGFLEYLPCLFEEVNTDRRVALRWAVYATSYASMSNDQDSEALGDKALHCYGQALSTLVEALAKPEGKADDYILMTVVILDLFEAIHLKNPLSRGSHAQGMAQILRLRGHDQFYDPRSWSLFRLAHHRIQKQQLAFSQEPLPESIDWFNSLNEMLPYVQNEKDNLEISKTCKRARDLRQRLDNTDFPITEVLDMVEEIQQLDRTTESWRDGPQWKYKIIHRSDVIGDKQTIAVLNLPEFIQLHRDVWIAYEWNYHRTARILLHEQLLRCLHRLDDRYPDCSENLQKALEAFKRDSVETVRALADAVLATVPQSLGDIDHEGRASGTSTCNAVGAYFLLWSIKVVKRTPSATVQQNAFAQDIFDRIRECTGMKSSLGHLSNI